MHLCSFVCPSVRDGITGSFIKSPEKGASIGGFVPLEASFWNIFALPYDIFCRTNLSLCLIMDGLNLVCWFPNFSTPQRLNGFLILVPFPKRFLTKHRGGLIPALLIGTFLITKITGTANGCPAKRRLWLKHQSD